MEGLKGFRAFVAITAAMLVITCSVISVQAQISSPCTVSQVISVTPCVNFITGSSASGSTPTAGCCDSVRSLMSGSIDCACLIVTGSVPLNLPINRTLALTLPQACSLPLQCKASGVPLPAPGPVLFAPPPPPVVPASSPLSPIVPASSPLSHIVPVPASSPHSHIVPASSPLSPIAAVAAAAPSPFSPTASHSLVVAGTPAETPAETPASPPVDSVAPTANPGIKPAMASTSASIPSYIPSPFVLLVFMGFMVFKSY